MRMGTWQKAFLLGLLDLLDQIYEIAAIVLKNGWIAYIHSLDNTAENFYNTFSLLIWAQQMKGESFS